MKLTVGSTEGRPPEDSGGDRGSPRPSYSKLSREQINELPVASYTGPVFVLDRREKVESAVRALAGERILAFDTKTRPSFQKGRSNLPSLVQLATVDAVYLFRIRLLGENRRLARILSDGGRLKVGVGVAQDVRTLREVFDFADRGFLDLTELTVPLGVPAAGLRTLAATLLGIRIPKGAKTSNWEREELTPAQIRYAAMDAWVSRRLYLKLNELRKDPEPETR